VPVIAVVLIVSLLYGAERRVLPRVVVMAGFAAAAELINERIVKPVVQERIHGTLSFPSGHVTAVCATAVAMWIALYPVLGRARSITFLLGAAWTLLMSVAVVGAFWHTPIDAIGSILLSVGVVTAGAAMLGPGPSPPSTSPVEPIRELERV
jgi:membrane-associated phospholipid phosphatase